MKMTLTKLWIIAAVSISLLWSLYIVLPHFLFGAEFKFNLTKRMQDETKLLDFCISNTTIKIPDVEKFCALSYGGLNTSYGESVDKK